MNTTHINWDAEKFKRSASLRNAARRLVVKADTFLLTRAAEAMEKKNEALKKAVFSTEARIAENIDILVQMEIMEELCNMGIEEYINERRVRLTQTILGHLRAIDDVVNNEEDHINALLSSINSRKSPFTIQMMANNSTAETSRDSATTTRASEVNELDRTLALIRRSSRVLPMLTKKFREDAEESLLSSPGSNTTIAKTALLPTMKTYVKGRVMSSTNPSTTMGNESSINMMTLVVSPEESMRPSMRCSPGSTTFSSLLHSTLKTYGEGHSSSSTTSSTIMGNESHLLTMKPVVLPGQERTTVKSSNSTTKDGMSCSELSLTVTRDSSNSLNNARVSNTSSSRSSSSSASSSWVTINSSANSTSTDMHANRKR